jgi:DNA recombination-dependent growth factor C
MILFLDFDGVLHPKGGQRLVHLPIFEKMVRGTDLKIVISSTWREVYSLSKLKSMFSEDIRPKIISATPQLPVHTTEYERSEEIHDWLRLRGNPQWLALDDDIDIFHPRDRSNVILCNGKAGLTESVLLALNDRLETV